MFAGGAAYRNWVMQFPQREYVWTERKKFKQKQPRRVGLVAPGSQMTPV